MRRGCHALLARYLGAMVALAIVVSSAVASYGHAACPHTTTDPHVDVAQQVVPSKVLTAEREAAKHQHGQNEPDKAHTLCLDGICHVGYAILSMSIALPALARAEAETVVAGIRGEPRISSLERPPRSSVLA